MQDSSSCDMKCVADNRRTDVRVHPIDVEQRGYGMQRGRVICSGDEASWVLKFGRTLIWCELCSLSMATFGIGSCCGVVSAVREILQVSGAVHLVHSSCAAGAACLET